MYQASWHSASSTGLYVITQYGWLVGWFQVVQIQQQLQQSMLEKDNAQRHMEEMKAAYLGMGAEAQQLQQDNEDLLKEHDAAKEQVRTFAERQCLHVIVANLLGEL